jgi:hypothetical protein
MSGTSAVPNQAVRFMMNYSFSKALEKSAQEHPLSMGTPSLMRSSRY